MAIKLSQTAFLNLIEHEANWTPYDPTDPGDWFRTYPPELGQGHLRGIYLQPGLFLGIAHYQLHEDLMMESVDREHPLEFTFHLSGRSQEQDRACCAKTYGFFGSGMAPGGQGMNLANQPIQEVSVHMEPELLHSFVGLCSEELPPEFEHLVRRTDQEYYSRHGTTTPTMQVVLQQILNCPYQGVTKRIFLESKVLELLALLLEQERAAKDCCRKFVSLKPDDIDRIHHARTILLQNLAHPPSLMELARAAGINDHKLKSGFRQLFGTTVFGYLHHYRMEQARQLLEAGTWKVEEVAHIVGYSDLSAFGRAFRKQFGICPKDCLRKNSV